MRSKMTKKEIIVRHLYANKGNWIPSYDLVKLNTEWGYTGLQADRRAFELAQDGSFSSPNFKYYIEAQRQGKYTYFRCTGRTPHEYVMGLKNYSLQGV